LAPEARGVGRGPEIPVVSIMKTIPAHAALLAKNIPYPRFADINSFAYWFEQYCAEWIIP
jgi:hypothetical protein